jgi:hypothetical protein
MHAADRNAHHHRTDGGQPETRARFEGYEQGRGGERHRENHGQGRQEGIMGHDGVHAHRLHAHKMHDDDAGAHDEAAEEKGRR